MCGITGYSSNKISSITISDFYKSVDKFSHRGPDSEGYFFTDLEKNSYLTNLQEEINKDTKINLALGFKRLSIMDLENGNQPFVSPDGRYVSIFNGEIYNFQELKKDLSFWNFKTESDGEIIIPMFMKYGLEFPKHLNGIFAIAIYDTLKNCLTLTRDHVGVKPIYYYEDSKIFAFSSEIKTLFTLPGINIKLNRSAIYDYLTFQNLLDNKSMFKDIQLLEKGSILQLKNGIKSSKIYWKYDDKNLTNVYNKEELYNLVDQAISLQLMSDVKVGTYLSSGLDTSIITTLSSMKNRDVTAITCGFDMEDSDPLFGVDERSLARKTAESLNINHNVYNIFNNSLANTIYQTIYHLDEPRMGYSYQNLLISNATSQQFKVVLSGVGSDELFGGYPWRYNFLKDNELDTESHFLYWNRVVHKNKANKAFIQNKYFQENFYPYETYLEALKVSKQSTGLSTIFAFEFNTFLQGLLIAEDKLSMANSLESRVPFLDINLVNYVIGIDPNKKFNEKLGKLLLRNSFKHKLNNEIFTYPKVGFVPPIQHWRNHDNTEFISKILNKKNIEKFEIFNFDYINTLLESFNSGKDSLARQLWSIICIQVWLDIFFGDALENQQINDFDYTRYYKKE